MKHDCSGRLVAAWFVGALAFPVGLTGQIAGDARITILQTTDLHHRANGSDHVGLDVDPVYATGVTGSYARIAAYVKYVRAHTNNPVVLVDSGDWTMGTIYDLTLSARPLSLLFMDTMKYDCVTLGNHEFDYTPKGLAQMLGAAQRSSSLGTPIVASNINLAGNTDLDPFVGAGKAIQPVRLQDLPNGLRIAYIGLMGRGAALDAPASVPITFTDFSTNYAPLQGLVDDLRNNQGAQVVIALSHSGTDTTANSGEDVTLATRVRGIDVIASGHTHTPLASARSVINSGWTTYIIDAGAFGTNVARIDLVYDGATKSTKLEGSGNVAMTEAGLASVQSGLSADRTVAALVAAADQELNAAFAAFFSQAFPDYDRTSLAKGIYHPVGTAAQTMVSNSLDPVPAPNGLGNLAADAVRSTANAIVAQALNAVGGNPAGLPAYDFKPFQAGLVATGSLRAKLQTGVSVSFADIYNVLSLGISPDLTQTLPVGYPIISVYLDVADVKAVCALQLLAQSGLAPGDYYLNLSGLKYGLKPAETYAYFKYATAAAVLKLSGQRAAAGSIQAIRAVSALGTLAQDNGAGLLALYANNNPFAGAMVNLNDSAPTATQIAANFAALGQMAAAAASDAVTGRNTATALVVSKAMAAIETVGGFAITDATNIGSTTDLPATSRVRMAADLFAILALGSVQAQFGVTITPYRSATGVATLSAADIAGILPNRISMTPAGPRVQELKEWMALLSYIQTGLNGTISSAYASTSDFGQFGSAGQAVQIRNASYPLDSIARFTGTLATLQGAPPCARIGTPAIVAVTNSTYGSALSTKGAIIVWGSGFSAGGNDSIRLTRAGVPDTVILDGGSGTYFWNLSPNQINATLPSGIASGPWQLSVRNACGATSQVLEVTLE